MMFDKAEYVSAGKFSSQGSWIHPKRCIDTDEIIYMLDGSAHICEDGNEYTLVKGDTMLLEKHKRHCGTRESNEHVSFIWMHFSGEDRPCAYITKHMSLEDSCQVGMMCRQLLHFANTNEYPKIVSDYFMRLILIELSVQSKKQLDKNSVFINEVREWVRINRGRMIKIKDISEHFGYNEDYLSKLFKSYYSMGLKEYIDDTRMWNIKNLLLQNDYSLKVIADMCGFDDYKYFLKYFCYHEDMTPSQFRKIYYNTHTNNH